MTSAARKKEEPVATGEVSATEKPGMHVANVIRTRRSELRIGQGELATMVGAHPQTMNKIERGEIEFSRFFPLIEQALQLDEGALTHGARGDSFTPAQASRMAAVGALQHDLGHGVKPSNVSMRRQSTLDAPSTPHKNVSFDLPLFSSQLINFDENVMALSAEAITNTARPEPLLGIRDAYSVRVSTTSMIPAYEPDDTLLVNPHLPAVDHKDVLLRSAIEGGGVGPDTILCRLEEITATQWVVREHARRSKGGVRKIARKAYPHCHRVIGKYCR